MIIKDLSRDNSLLNHFVAELRDVDVHTDSLRFRRNLERVGEIMAYEISKTLSYKYINIQTPLGKKEISLIETQPVLCTILRAGLPLHQGLLNFFDKAENTFVSAFRYHPGGEKSFEIVVEYLATPFLGGKVLLVSDPMLATGESMVSVYRTLLKQGTPSALHIVSVVASSPGIEYISEHLPKDTTLWTAAIDEHLNDKKYIVPGLGDAGDLAFGKKI